MTSHLTGNLADAPVVTAPDGLTVRILNAMEGGSMAEFTLRPNQVGRTIRHRTVEEIWLVTAGQGQMWRAALGVEATELLPGVCASIPPRTAFQVRAGDQGLTAVAITMPPWPGDDEAEVLTGTGPWD